MLRTKPYLSAMGNWGVIPVLSQVTEAVPPPPEPKRPFAFPVAKQRYVARGIVVLIDGDQNHAFTITLWEKQTDLEASEASGYLQLQLAKSAQFLAAASTREVYEVGVLE